MTDRLRRTTRPNLVSLESRVTPALAFALAGSNLLSFDTAFPTVTKSVAITNVAAGETLQAIDVRPMNGHLYGLASNGTGGVRLYDISVRTGKATALTAAAVSHTDALGTPVAIGGTRFEIDFNPTVDRVRVVSDTGVNFRMNPNTGGLIDSDNNALTGINADGALTLNAVAATGGGTAYTNSVINAGATTQYTIDATTKQLTIQNPPNNGVLTKAVSISADGVVAVNFTAVGGFDVPTTVTVAASNDIAAGTGFAVLTVGGKATLHTIDLTTGKATAVNTVGDGSAVTGFALGQDLTNGLGVFSLDGLTLTRFQRNLPAGSKAVAVGGVLATETLVGFDIRPATGQFVGVGFDATANTGTVYLIDPQTGAATPLVAGTQSGVSFAGVDLIDEAYGIDFNPTVDRIRVVSASGFNFRLNPNTGLAVDSDNDAGNGNTPDGKINALGVTGITGTAYTNSFGGAATTTQYGIDPATDKIYIQTPPNSGTQTAAVAVTLGGAPLNFTAVGGFDISPRVGAPAAVAQTANVAFVGLTVNGVAGLYTVNLATGEAVAQTGPAGVNFGSLAIADPLFNQNVAL